MKPLSIRRVVAPLLILASAGIFALSKPATLYVVWHSIRSVQTPAAQAIGLLFGATLVPFVAACLVTLRQNRDPAWPMSIAAFPAIGSALVGAYVQSGPVLYPNSSRVEEHAASLASEWWHSSQMTAAGFYLSTFLLLVSGIVSAVGACRAGLRDEPIRRQTIVAFIGPALVVALGYAWMRYAQLPMGRLLHNDTILPPAALAITSLAIIHMAAGAKVPGKSIFPAYVAALLAILSFAVAQALPAGSNAEALGLAPFEWVIAAGNISEKQLRSFVPAISYMVPLILFVAIAVRDSWSGWKNLLFPIAPGFLLVAIGTLVAFAHTRKTQNDLASAFRRHVPSDVTLASGPPGSFTSCVDLTLDNILFVGRDQITLNGQTIASTRQLDSPATCADIAQRVHTTVPRLAMDEHISFAQTTCLLNAFAHREPRVCQVIFVGRCKAGTRVDNDETPACTEQMQANVPLCTEQALDVDGCPSPTYPHPFVILTPSEVFTVHETKRVLDSWPTNPVRDDGVWKRAEIPNYYATIAATSDTTMGGFIALALQLQGLPIRLRPSATPAPELPKAPSIVNPLGVRAFHYVSAGSDAAHDAFKLLLNERNENLRRCLEPDKIPWLVEVGVIHLLVGRNGKPVGVWPARHANGRFEGCVAKVLGDFQIAPQPQSVLATIDLRFAAVRPNIHYWSRWNPRPEKTFPKNSVSSSEISYVIDRRSSSITRQLKPILSTMQCLGPALMRNKTLHGTITFDLTVDDKNTQVSSHSDIVDKDSLECLEKWMQQTFSEAFRWHFRYWPIKQTEMQYFPIEFKWMMDIRVPDSIGDSLSVDFSSQRGFQ